MGEEVSLTLPYDGGAFPLAPTDTWIVETINSAASASSSTDLLTIAVDEIGRLFSGQAQLIAGAQANVMFQVRVPNTLFNCIITEDGHLTPVTGDGPAWMRINAPIILPPESTLRGFHVGGDVLTVIGWRYYVAVAPLGSVFGV